VCVCVCVHIYIQYTHTQTYTHTHIHTHTQGVTHCLWYMDAHEVVMERVAMSDAVFGSKAKILTSANPPHTIVDINQMWIDTCLLQRQEVVGKTLAVVQGSATAHSATREACKRLGQRKAGYVEVIRNL
jgi:hypothetical protein